MSVQTVGRFEEKIMRFRRPFLALIFCLATGWQGAAKAQDMPAQQEVSAQQQFVKETVYDFAALTATPLNPRVLKSTEADGIVTEEVMFHSEMDGEKSVDIFAFFAYPKGAKGLPAFVWNQAGLGRAGTYFTNLGAKRGYAVLCIDMPLPGYRSTGGYPISMDFPNDMEPRANPLYHGAVALLKAVSYLESRPEVDKERIGMAGSSWGGFYTTMMAGIDPRIKAASAMFGTGNLQLGHAWWDGNGNSAARDAAFREKWRTTLDPGYRLPQSKAAIGWFTGTNDHFYWMPAVMKSYEMAPNAKHLMLMPNWDHGLPPVGDEQVFAWLDIHLQGKPEFLKAEPLTVEKIGNTLSARWSYSGSRKFEKGHLILSYGGPANWEGRAWTTLPADTKGRNFRVKLPNTAIPYYISGTVVDSDGYISSTPIVLVEPGKLGVTALTDKPNFDGATVWGDFEADGIAYLKGNGLARPFPTVVTEAQAGKQAVTLNKGRNSLSGLYFAAGLPHRLTVYMKADKETKIEATLGGTFDGKPLSEKKEFTVGTQWAPQTIDIVAPNPLAGTLSLVLTVPEGVTVSVDSLTFRPQ